MYQDKSLVPAEAVRLAALGSLRGQTKSYADLASEIRQFVARIVGPSLDLLGSSLEILRLDGLIAPVSGDKVSDDTVMQITDAGVESFLSLMESSLRVPLDDTGRLVMALKLRFLFYLPKEEQLDQIDLLRELAETELARLEDLKRLHGEGALAASLDLDIDQTRARIAWFNDLEKQLEDAA